MSFDWRVLRSCNSYQRGSTMPHRTVAKYVGMHSGFCFCFFMGPSAFGDPQNCGSKKENNENLVPSKRHLQTYKSWGCDLDPAILLHCNLYIDGNRISELSNSAHCFDSLHWGLSSFPCGLRSARTVLQSWLVANPRYKFPFCNNGACTSSDISR